MKFTKQQMRTGNNRLSRLVYTLRYEVSEEQFDYSNWVGSDWKGKADLSCGTTACALGWATTIPSLRKTGLRLQRGVNSWGDLLPGTVINIKNPSIKDPFEVAQKVFALSYQQSEFLFAPNLGESTATPRQVADKIEEFIDAREEILNSLK